MLISMKSYDRSEVNQMIRTMQGEQSLRSFAKTLKISAAYLSDVMRNNREPGPRILAPLHLRRVKEATIYYVKERA